MGSSEAEVERSTSVRARLFRQLGEQARQTRRSEPPRAYPQSASAPLAAGQERLWLLSKISPTSASFHIPAVLRLEGPLDVEALRWALGEVTRRHAALRTVLRDIAGAAAQVVQAPREIELPVHELRNEIDARDDRLHRRIQQDAARAFDLAAGPLLRASLYRLGEQDHRLLIVVHHVVADGWSMDIVLQEIGQLYEARVRGVKPTLPEPAIAFQDVARWEREEDTRRQLDEQLEYWCRKLDRAASTQLPTDYARPPVLTANADMLSFGIGAELTARLERVCREQAVTAFMGLLAAFDVLLARYTGSDDICIGTTVANRTWQETQYVVGLFANLVVLRSDLSGQPTFAELLARVRATTLQAYENQAVSFHRVVEKLKPHRDRSHSPLFQINFVFHNTRSSTATMGVSEGPSHGGLRVASEGWSEPQALYDLSVYITPEAGSFKATFTYNTDLYRRETVERLARQFVFLLEDALARPHARISDLHVCTPQDEAGLRALAGQSASPDLAMWRVDALFEEQARAAPQAVAVVDGDTRITYGQLNARANRLAAFLRACGVGSETLVGICLPRDADVVVAILAILKAGAAYVPLDPDAPAERLQTIMASAGLAIVVTKQALARHLPAYEMNFVNVLYLDELAEEIATYPAEDLAAFVTAEHLAYIIYTSGSTGAPKGVAVEHGAIVRLVKRSNYIACGPQLSVAQASTIAFDASVFEIWAALLNGARLTFVGKDELLDPDRFAACVARTGVNTVFVTTALLNRYAQYRPAAFAKLDTILFGGEQVDPQSVRRLLATNPHTKVVHVYGPTENTVFSTYHPVCAVANHATTVPIGRMLSGTVGYVLDRALKLAPIGAVGELYLGGCGLARGYQNAPLETALKFIPDPYSPLPGARMYRTGDLVRWNAAGEIEFIGRRDGQIKLRGFRIETAEIEAALAGSPAVSAAAVVAKSAPGQEQRLVAYWTAAQGANADARDLHDFLSARLPDYMIPKAFVRLEALPLNLNGKIDRDALPQPGLEDCASLHEAARPRTAQERAVAAAFASALAIPEPGIEANFFALGGDSLRAISLKAELEERGYSFAIHELFEHPTVAGLTPVLKPLEGECNGERGAYSMLESQDRRNLPADVEDAYPLSCLQLGMLFHDDYQGHVYHEVIYYRVEMVFREAALRAALDELAARHEMLRTSFALAGYTQPLQLVHRTAIVPLHVVDLRELSQSQQRSVLETWLDEEKRRGHDPATAPLLGIHVHVLAHERLQLGLCFSHAILDGWSDAALVVELLQLYEAHLEGRSVALPGLKARYRDYIELERLAIEDGQCGAFWRRTLHGCQVTSVTPGGAPANAMSVRGGHVRINVGAATLERLKQLSKSLGMPLKSILLAAHMKVLSLFGGSRDVVCGLVTNGRPESKDGDRVVGLFLNSVPLRLMLAEQSWQALIRQVFEAETSLLPYRRYPLPRIMQDLQSGRLFQAVFNYTDFHVAQLLEPQTLARVSGPGGKIETSIPVAVNFTSHNDGSLHGAISYHSAVCPADRAEHIAACMERVLEAIALDPKCSHSARNCLPPRCDPQQQAWYAAEESESQEEGITQLIDEQIAQHAGSLAVQDDESEITYSELARRASQLAAQLRQQGVTDGAAVGVYGPRCVDWVVNVLAVWKAGAAYLPLDPTYPPARLMHIARTAGAQIGISRSGDRQRVAELGLQALAFDENALARKPALSVPVGDQLAYILFTSGTTGTPKGVEITHRALANLALAQRQLFDLGPSDRVLQFSNTGFDASVWELVMALANGAFLVIVADEARRSREALRELLSKRGMTVATLPPSVLSTLSDCVLPELRVLVAAGEACPSALVERWAGVTRFFNAYGPTEYTVCTSAQAVTLRDLPPAIGTAIRNTQMHILDASLHPVPIGTVGELYVSGVGLARGYASRPDLTAERFLPNPFAHTRGARMYRTGDLARFTPAGSVEYIGRTDQQVKVRGHRIELAEIEDLIGKYPGVTRVLCLPSGEAERRTLIAHYSTRSGTVVTGRELRAHMRGFVAEFAIPSVFVHLQEFPLTQNGKIDRDAVGRMCLAADGEAHVPPVSATEHALVRIWQQVLRREPIGVRDDLFQLGGNSLFAMELVACMRRELQSGISVADLYKAPTIEEAARVIDAGRPGSAIVTLRESAGSESLFLVHAVGGTVWCYGQLASRLGGTLAVHAIQRPELARGEPPRILSVTQLAEIYSRHIEEQQPHGPYAIAGWSFGGVLALEIAGCLRRRGRAVGYVGMIDSRLPSEQEREAALKMLTNAAAGADLQDAAALDNMMRDEQLRSALDAEIGMTDPAAAELAPEQAAFARRIALANAVALYRHVPSQRVKSVHYIAATAAIGPQQLDERLTHLQRCGACELTVTQVAATHSSVLQMPKVEEVAASMRGLCDGRSARASRASIGQPGPA